MLAQLARETLTLDLTLDFARKMHFETEKTIEVNYPQAFFFDTHCIPLYNKQI